MGTGNMKNLRPPFTSEEAREMGRKGAKASAEARRAKRDFAEALKILINLPEHSGKVADISKIKNIDDLKKANLTLGDRMLMKLAIRALNSDPSFALLRDQIGETPTDPETMKSSAIDNLANALKVTKQAEGDGHIDEVPP